MTSVQDEVLEHLAGAVCYRQWICDLARPWLGDDPLEVGSGTGDYAAEWASTGVPMIASEAEPGRVAAMQQRFAGNPRVEVRALQLPAPAEGSHSAVVAINVLEHIQRDVDALESMRSLVRPDGHVVLFVPAFEFAMSRFDREVGHHRRYRRRELATKLQRAGLQPQTVHYVNAPGLLAWFLMMRLAGGRPHEGFALQQFERLVPTLSQIEGRWRPPFGQSIFAVGRKI